MVTLIGIVRCIVIFETVDPTIVVEIHTEEKVGPIDIIAQERFVIIRKVILPVAIAVLVKIREEIAVFVIPGKNRGVTDALGPHPELLPWDRH